MKIAIDITYEAFGGNITQLKNMVFYLRKIPNINVIIFLSKKNQLITNNINDDCIEIRNVKYVNLSVGYRVFWQQLILPFYLFKYKCDILFSPGNITTILSPIKTIQWVGTIGPFLKDFYKEFALKEKFKIYLNKLFMIGSAYSSNAVIFESHYTKKLLIKRYFISEDKSHVINIGKDVFFEPKNTKYKPVSDDDYKKYEPYVLCVSHLYPYKNIIRMLTAFHAAIQKSKLKVRLLIAGSDVNDHYSQEIKECIKSLSMEKYVVLMGSVDKNKLKNLYINCMFLLFPSPFENFAYTLVEAMSCGSAIVSSNTTAMPETCGDAALYFNPYNVKDMQDQIYLMLTNEKLRQSYKERSLKRVNQLPDFQEVTLNTLRIMQEVGGIYKQ